ncbi:MAG: phosphate ABC transporter ATP-binding protein, partial [Chloroflexi bacterium]|nr:phosphate ABC transporter ATP-binding protein [Chloroflexota bacterium]
MTNVVYQLSNLIKTYGGREICRVEELAVYRGEILGIMGPSGAGKSTLLRLLALLEPPTAGRLHYNGFTLNNGKQLPLGARRKVTMVFQEPILLNASVWDNVAYGLRVRGQRHIDAIVRHTLEKVGLGDLAQTAANILSGGEAQRVALARALVIAPEVLLLDEPTANLDPYNVALLERIIAEVNREQGTTIVLVTHNVFQARRICHRVMLMLEGKAVELGQTENVFTHPQDP